MKWGSASCAAMLVACGVARAGDPALVTTDELLAATFRDPEGWYHLARQLSYVSEADRALIATWKYFAVGFVNTGTPSAAFWT